MSTFVTKDYISVDIENNVKPKIRLHRPKRKMRQTFYKKIKNLSNSLFGDVKASLKGIILFDNYNILSL